MKKFIYLILIASLIAGCALNLVTGRKQLSLVKESDLRLMAVNEYRTFLSDNKVLNSANNRDAALVDRVGARDRKSVV